MALFSPLTIKTRKTLQARNIRAATANRIAGNYIVGYPKIITLFSYLVIPFSFNLRSYPHELPLPPDDPSTYNHVSTKLF
jgi:hypothetical protein